MLFFFSPLFQGVLTESAGEDATDHMFSLIEGADSNRAGIHGGKNDELLMGDEDGDTSVATVEDQLHKEMAVYEVCYAIELVAD